MNLKMAADPALLKIKPAIYWDMVQTRKTSPSATPWPEIGWMSTARAARTWLPPRWPQASSADDRADDGHGWGH